MTEQSSKIYCYPFKAKLGSDSIKTFIKAYRATHSNYNFTIYVFKPVPLKDRVNKAPLVDSEDSIHGMITINMPENDPYQLGNGMSYWFASKYSFLTHKCPIGMDSTDVLDHLNANENAEFFDCYSGKKK